MLIAMKEATRNERQLDAGPKCSAEALNKSSLPKATGRVIIDVREIDAFDLGRHIDGVAYACPPGAQVVLIVRRGQHTPVLRHVSHLGGIEIQSDDPSVVASWISWLRSWGVAS